MYSARLPFKKIPRTTFQHKMPVTLKSTGRTINIDKKEYKQAKKTIQAVMNLHRPDEVLKGPYLVYYFFTFVAPKCRLKNCRDEGGIIWSQVKPDVDNLVKGFNDCLVNCGWLENDQSISGSKGYKFEVLPEEGERVDIFIINPGSAIEFISKVYGQLNEIIRISKNQGQGT